MIGEGEGLDRFFSTGGEEELELGGSGWERLQRGIVGLKEGELRDGYRRWRSLAVARIEEGAGNGGRFEMREFLATVGTPEEIGGKIQEALALRRWYEEAGRASPEVLEALDLAVARADELFQIADTAVARLEATGWRFDPGSGRMEVVTGKRGRPPGLMEEEIRDTFRFLVTIGAPEGRHREVRDCIRMMLSHFFDLRELTDEAILSAVNDELSKDRHYPRKRRSDR